MHLWPGQLGGFYAENHYLEAGYSPGCAAGCVGVVTRPTGYMTKPDAGAGGSSRF